MKNRSYGQKGSAYAIENALRANQTLLGLDRVGEGEWGAENDD